jgi:hypothetical protein
MTRLGFEPTIPVFERAKNVHALGRAALWSASSVHTLPKIVAVSPQYVACERVFVFNFKIFKKFIN